MEGKKVFVSELLVLTLFMCMLLASARHPFFGLPLLGKQVGGSDLMCCDSCDCGDSDYGNYCVCTDYVGGYTCTEGCNDCDCSSGEYCQCLDTLYGCPDRCNSDYISDQAPAENIK